MEHPYPGTQRTAGQSEGKKYGWNMEGLHTEEERKKKKIFWYIAESFFC